MNGGIIDQLAMEPDGIFIQVCGVGCYRHKSIILKITPTNYALREGDLVWWQGGYLHWEGRRQVQFPCQRQEAMTCH